MGRVIRSRKNSGAYTLIEIMIALVLFTVGIISIMYLFPISLRDAYRARVMTQAAFLAQARMEEELAQPGPVLPTHPSGNFEPDFPDFVYVVRKGTYDDNVGIYKIEVSIFHPINNRKIPLAQLSALKATMGELPNEGSIPLPP